MWDKKGMIYNVNGEYGWNKSHAQVPVVDVLSDRLRIYYATRNSLGKSNVFSHELSCRILVLSQPFKMNIDKYIFNLYIVGQIYL